MFVVSAPSGTGKTTLVRKVQEELPGLRFSISFTTRPPRANEREGKDYCFVSEDAFMEMAKKGNFLEWANVLGHYYGTPKIDLETLKSEGFDIILDIDTQGARRVMEKLNEAVLIYLLPPSLEILEKRLKGRGLDSPERIKFRMAGAKKDMEEVSWYHHVIVNDTVEESVRRLKSIVITERKRKILTSAPQNKKEEKHGTNHCGGLPQGRGKPI